MKKIYQLSISACALCALMAFAGCISCGDGDYQQACEEGDFVKAYKCAKSADAERYVILHEAMYILASANKPQLLIGDFQEINKRYNLHNLGPA